MSFSDKNLDNSGDESDNMYNESITQNKFISIEDDDDENDDNENDDLTIEEEDLSETDDENCLYNNLSDKVDPELNKDISKLNERITKPLLFKYERVRILGDRVKQLSSGAKPMIKNAQHLDPRDIARLELKHNVIPLIIKRTLPNNKIEYWKINELKH